MKKLITAIAAAVFIIYPCVCSASYIIHLKDGREFTTDRYYEEGDQIKFKRYGGLIGIKKDQVKEIEEIEDVPEEKAAGQQEVPVAAEKTEAGKQNTNDKDIKDKDETKKVKEQRKAGKGSKEKSDTEKNREETEYEKQRRALRYKYVEARKRLARAIMNDDKLASKAARSEMSKISKQLSEVDRKIKANEAGEKKVEIGDIGQYKKEKSVLLGKYLKISERLKKAKDADDAVAKEVAEMEMSEILRKLSEVERKIRNAADTKKHD